MSREEMQNNIINKYGFEHNKTIEFYKVCEMLTDTKKNNKVIEYLYRKVMDI